jgi:hypothetical protein
MSVSTEPSPSWRRRRGRVAAGVLIAALVFAAGAGVGYTYGGQVRAIPLVPQSAQPVEVLTEESAIIRAVGRRKGWPCCSSPLQQYGYSSGPALRPRSGGRLPPQ